MPLSYKESNTNISNGAEGMVKELERQFWFILGSFGNVIQSGDI